MPTSPIEHAAARLAAFADSIGLDAESFDETIHDLADACASARNNAGEGAEATPGEDAVDAMARTHDEESYAASAINNGGMGAQFTRMLEEFRDVATGEAALRVFCEQLAQDPGAPFPA